ncbi:MAG: hypothetical protein CO030_05180 [Candidatus Magasanikbacteria bacterium CG_4_9_14_0_2_um_filter_42_11]|uniref:Peptidase S8/S53 domain-containing protein n=1 Tax=Candidatus Magasanikbacteria bacterium CG_4_9_14_0_2_um_filter_42_11 TaxID=1974643 RepID=A0A2M8F8F0_9BACT|nr:MAG: hypothetical protein COU34_00660 [Candidatus Magasanikbacteria bacterium CG10_big_fil_rev_8_21_14_0_10_43_9]PIY92199.1 MAG: hypothetical protein COY70_04525 [Candidatus Magasanikbacteria bacterium CG_4_10_14_0_8_um_filter_42_12]PJC51996.1 MAG: hypothetical protein CO030_05180 [Candidatus Magasanikbacteria bacterium CG_4_9_14_0_2_um_filter_42_11]
MFYKKRVVGIIVVFFAVLCMPQFVHAVNDPLSQQWAYNDTGVYAAWAKTQGSRDVIVAVIDNGFDMLHPDILGNAWTNTDEVANNGIDDDNNGYIDDVWGWSFIPEDVDGDGVLSDRELLGMNNPRPRPEGLTNEQKQEGILHHGTVVAGLIGAVGNNAKGLSGVAQQVRLMNVRVVDESGQGTFNMLDEAIRYAVDNGASVINMSLVGPGNEEITAAIEYAYKEGVVVVAAAGNNRQDLNLSPLYPLCEDAGVGEQRILGVSSIDEAHHISSFSNQGSTCIDITAPGDGVTSTVRFSPTNGLTEQYLGGWHGTSFAAPLVSGAAALVKAIQPSWGPKEIYTALLSTVHRTAGQDDAVYKELFGAGLLQVDKAVAYALERVTANKDFQDILFVSAQTGVSENSMEWHPSTVYSNTLQNIDDVTMYAFDGQSGYLTVQKKNNAERLITRYTEDWESVGSFAVSAVGPLHIASFENTIFVSPEYSDTLLFSAYSLSGSLLTEYHVTHEHSGASLGVSESGVLYTYSAQPSLTVQRFDAPFTQETSHFTVQSLSKRGSIAVADIDGDHIEELALGGAVGDRPLMSYYEQDGTYRRTFIAYDSYVHGFSIHSVDYDRDGRDDIVTIPYANTQPVRIWTNKSKKIAEWQTFSSSRIVDQIATVRFF